MQVVVGGTNFHSMVKRVSEDEFHLVNGFPLSELRRSWAAVETKALP